MKFKLDDLPGSKPVMGVDDLLLGLTHHWSRDRSVFPTEDDRLDLAMIMLFQAYTACRPAELVDGTKAKGGKDPLQDDLSADGEVAPTATIKPCRGSIIEEYVRADSNYADQVTQDDQESDSEFGVPVFDDGGGYDDGETDNTEYSVSLYDDDWIHAAEPPGAWDSSSFSADDHAEPVRRPKTICYEDIILWIVKDPKGGQRDVLAMEVFFRHHKGADNKPKPYGNPYSLHIFIITSFLCLLLMHIAEPSSYFEKILFLSSVLLATS